MSKCLLFKHGMTIGPTGGTRPCCAFNTNGIKTIRFDEDWKTRHDEWYDESSSDWVMPGCRQCHDQETIYNHNSMRQRYNREFKDAEGIKLWDLKINNTCNLACRMCDPTSSSQWERIAKENNPDGLDEYYKQVPPSKWWRDSISLLDEMYDASYVKFTGGEPFLIPQVKQIVEGLVEKDIAPAVTLQFTTNGTQDITNWYPLFKKFKGVELIVSIDATEERYEYIRAGANWKQVSNNVTNIKKYCPSNMHIDIHCLPQALNVGYTHLVEEWASSLGLRCEVVSALYEPEFMRPEALSDPILKNKLIKQLEILDKVHGTNWRNFIDE